MTKLRADIAVPATVERAKMLAAAGKGADAKALLAALNADPSLKPADRNDVSATLAALGGAADAPVVPEKSQPPVAQLAPVAQANPDDPALQLALGRGYGDAGQYPQAIEAFAAAYRLDPKNTAALAALIDAAIRGR